MAVTVTGTPANRALPSAGETSSTFSVTVPAGTTQLWVGAVNVRFTPPRTVSSIAFNTSEGLTQEASSVINVDGGSGDYTRGEWWYLDNPTATTANVVVTWSGSARGGVVAICLTGGKTGAADAVNTTGQASTSANSCAVTTTSDGILLSLFGADDGDNVTASLTAGTEHFNFIGSAGAGGQSMRTCLADQAGTGGSVTTTWTPTGSPLTTLQSVVAIGAAAGGGGSNVGGGAGIPTHQHVHLPTRNITVFMRERFRRAGRLFVPDGLVPARAGR